VELPSWPRGPRPSALFALQRTAGENAFRSEGNQGGPPSVGRSFLRWFPEHPGSIKVLLREYLHISASRLAESDPAEFDLGQIHQCDGTQHAALVV